MRRILVSSCLLGMPVRYDGGARTCLATQLAEWRQAGRVVAFCPEVAAGLGIPRPPAEIDGGGGADVLNGRAAIHEINGADVTAAYIAGARAALDQARATGCHYALLTDGSPSCGSRSIYDGRFAGQRHAGEGVTAALLRSAGISVFAESEIATLAACIARDEA